MFSIRGKELFGDSPVCNIQCQNCLYCAQHMPLAGDEIPPLSTLHVIYVKKWYVSIPEPQKVCKMMASRARVQGLGHHFIYFWGRGKS